MVDARGRVGTCRRCGVVERMKARSLCSYCYHLMKNRRELERYPRATFSPAEYFALIDTSDPEACWPWPGPLDEQGYGNCHGVSAYRWSYTTHVGPVPDGLVLDHACHNPTDCPGGVTCPHRRCVNPQHLRPVTHLTNIRASKVTIASKNAAKTHCARAGHPLSGDNLMVKRNGARQCRACTREQSRESQRRAVARMHARGLTKRGRVRRNSGEPPGTASPAGTLA